MNKGRIKINKELILLLLFISTLSIVTRNLYFLLLYLIIVIYLFNNKIKKMIIKTDNFYQFVEKGVFKSSVGFVGSLAVDDVEYDFRDFDGEVLKTKIINFYKILNINSTINIIIQKISLDREQFLSKVFQKIQNLRIELEADPSNQRVQNEIRILEDIVKRVNSGDPPFRYGVLIMTQGSSVDEVKAQLRVIQKGLESLGIRARPAEEKDISDFFQAKLPRINGISTAIPWATALTIPRYPSKGLIEKGLYLGRDLELETPVFWNIESSLNPHVLILGPSGTGKTETLLSIAVKLSIIDSVPTVIFDIKGDFKKRLRNYGIPFYIINPLYTNFNLIEPYYCTISDRISQIERILSLSFGLSKEISAELNAALKMSVELKGESLLFNKLSWNDVLDSLNRLEIENRDRLILNKVINTVLMYDIGKSDFKIKNGINVVDLSLIRNDDIIRLYIYSILTNLMNIFSMNTPDEIKVGVIIDEAWTLLRYEGDFSIIAEYVKKGRGYGISIMVATQNVSDLGLSSDVYLNNMGLTIIMNNGDKELWKGMNRYVTINEEDIKDSLVFLNRGEALIRFLGDPRPVRVKLDVMKR
ncbi:hypothetical protein HS7_20960 [Sulfolobales archaeon HS-7]|nr:hypothetical protein HS7_20960 [Sulfolobales archaeon HS-7]